VICKTEERSYTCPLVSERLRTQRSRYSLTSQRDLPRSIYGRAGLPTISTHRIVHSNPKSDINYGESVSTKKLKKII
jgi:hypothetical protein